MSRFASVVVVTAALSLTLTSAALAQSAASAGSLSYPIVDSGQTWCFDDDSIIPCGASHDGQDAQYEGLQPAYVDNGDGTVTDLVTGLMWIADPGEKTTYAEAMATLEGYELAGYDDWRLPTVKELYSLSIWSGLDPSGLSSSDVDGLEPFIDDDVFTFRYGDESGGARVIDSQWLTSTVYESEVMNSQSCFLGYNFADGRIKCYPLQPRGNGAYFALFVRGAADYGINDFTDNGNGTVSDLATGLTWTQTDSGEGVEWSEALAYCADLSLAGAEDWRLPNVKELQSIVDYSRSPDTTDSAAIDPVFDLTEITNEAGETDWGHYWSSTTFLSYGGNVGAATYIAFGRALGYMEEFGGWVDVHGAGAQRSDSKVDTGESYRGPQGDAIRSQNHVMCVTGGEVAASAGDAPNSLDMGSTSAVPEAGPDDAVAAPQGVPQAGPLADTAQKLGVSEAELVAAIGEPGSGPPDLQAAAQRLGVTVDRLRAALPAPSRAQAP